MIKFIFRWATLFALCNATHSFFSIKPVVVNAFMKRHYNNNAITLRRMSNGADWKNETNDTSAIPLLRPKPIPIISFDDLFLNWHKVNRIFLSEDCDRIILLYGNDKKGVYYINPDQLLKIQYLISLTTTIVTIETVENLDDPWFHLYCSPPSKHGRENASSVANGTIVNKWIFNTSDITFDKSSDVCKDCDANGEDECKCVEKNDDIEDGYGFDFGLGM